MDKAIKIDFVANGMLYKDIGNIQLFYYFNLINLVVCHFVLFIEIFINFLNFSKFLENSNKFLKKNLRNF